MSVPTAHYRKDIDGLRSIAVLLVVFNHVGFSAFSGGYVGVDIFFVISGFLITSIIYKGLLNGTFSFTNFYVRRIKRLMPALFTVLFVTSLFAILTLYPSDLVKFAKSLIWVIFYAGNFFFWLEHGGYFEGNTQEAPLLHTWSLAVEEQYYLVWPLYLILGLKLLKPKHFMIATACLFVACVCFSEWALSITIGAAYYLLPTRMFELMLGSLLAMYWTSLPRIPQPVSHALSLTGIGLIAYAAFTLSETSPFPGFNALYPTVGAACIILANQNTTGVVNRLLSAKPFVFIGLISYSLYLWHWPILVFIRYRAIEMTFPVQLMCIALATFLAWLSWKFVEVPIRNNKTFAIKPVAVRWLLQPMLLSLVVAIFIISKNGLAERFSNEIALMDTAYNSLSHELRPLCHASLRDSLRLPDTDCTLGATENTEKRAFLFGDSHANHLAGFVDVLAKDAGIAIQDYTLDQCPPLFDFAWGRNGVTATACLEHNNIAMEHIKTEAFDYVLLGSSWPARVMKLYHDGQLISDLEESAALTEAVFNRTINSIVAAGSIPIVFDDIPFLGSTIDPKCPIKKAAFNQDLSCSITKNTNVFFEEIITRALITHPQIIRITLADLMCRDAVCMLEADGVPLYSDNDHLNYLGSVQLGNLYLQSRLNPLR